MKGDHRRPADQIRVRMNLHTVSLIALVMAMGYSGAAQSNGAAYLMAFLTAAVAAASYVHARTNLKGLEITPGAVTATKAGRGGSLPLTLRAASGQSPCGLELLAMGAGKATQVERIASGESQRTSVALAPPREGIQTSVRLLVRSAYPLGLFSAERQMEVDCLRRVHPKADGDLPLPEPDPSLRQEALTMTQAATDAGRTGEDFAGLREWHAGDSPRHIDWRAYARGRPLMVKTWSGAPSDAVKLDWDSLSLPQHERCGQIAKWIEMCEARKIPYALHLPDCDVPVGLGEAHAKRCLDSLAEIAAGTASAETPDSQSPVRIPATFERAAHLPRRPLMLLCLGLALAAAPLWPVLSPACLILLAGCIAWRWMDRGRSVAPWVPPLVAVLGMAGVLLQEKTLLTTEAGIGILVVLQGCKLLESRSPHDFQVLAMISWFVCLCQILAEQSLDRAILSFGVYFYILLCMIRFRRSAPGLRTPARLSGVLLLQALPIAVLLFLAFPRGTLDALAHRLGSGQTTLSGVPTELDPGAIEKVANSSATAFRVRFGEGQMPPIQQRYWRCVVLWECQGLHWRRGANLLSPPPGEHPEQTQLIHQEIDMEPHGQFWLPALDYPIRARATAGTLAPEFDGTLQSREPVRYSRRIYVDSDMAQQRAPLPEAHRQAALQEPEHVSEELRKLAGQWRQASQNDLQIVQMGLAYLRQQRFRYTMDPGVIKGKDPLEEFWLRKREGFCGHFSAAYATMMRLAGVPSRVVMGYLGGTWNSGGNYFLVRQADAHAWVEVWLERAGWTRVDPTAIVVPARVNLDLQSSLLGDEAEAERQRASLWWLGQEAVRLFWDNVNYQWNSRVIQFDEDTQMEWLGSMGLLRLMRSQWRDVVLLGFCALAAIFGLAILMLWLRRPARQRDPWARAWQELCERLTRAGLPRRESSEGPLAYAQRVRSHRPAVAAEVDRLAAVYAGARYGEQKASLRDYRKAGKRLAKAVKA